MKLIIKILGAVLLTCFTVGQLRAQNITAAEYFIDADPGTGKGITINVGPAAEVDLNFAISAVLLSEGFHQLYTRVKDNAGHWSLAEERPFYIDRLIGSTTAKLSAAEYFIDTDPGTGKGTSIAAPAGDSSAIVINIPVASLAAGFHQLYVRSKDNAGHWSIAEQRAFYIDILIGSTASKLSGAEYFIDADPGQGSGTAINTTTGDSSNIILNMGVSSLTSGFHQLYVRSKDVNGKWSIAEQRPFYVDDLIGVTVPNLSAAEYFIDTDPGVGKGTALDIAVTGDSANITKNIPVNGLGIGFHQLYTRAKDRNGNWSIAEQRPFFIDGELQRPLSPIVAAEYFISADSGITKGISIPIVKSDSVNFNFNFTAPNLPLGNYTVNVRLQDSTGKWSIAESRGFRVCSSYGPKADFEIVKDNNNVIFVNKSNYTNLNRWSFGDGDTARIEKPFHVYKAGNYNVRLIASNPCAADTIIKQLTIEGIDNIYPNYGGNIGFVNALIKGFGFKEGTTISITNGTNLLVIDTISILSAEKIYIRLNLTGAVAGKYNLVITVPGVAQNLILQNSFTVEAGREPVFTSSFTAPPIFRAGKETKMMVTITNSGNISAAGIPVIISGFPIGAIIKVKLDSVPNAYFKSLTPSFTDTSINFVIKDTAINEQFVAFIIPSLDPGKPFTVPIYVTSPPSELELEISVLSPDYDFGSLGLFRKGDANLKANSVGSIIDCGAQAVTGAVVDIARDKLLEAAFEILIKDQLTSIRLCARSAYNLGKGIVEEFAESDFKDPSTVGVVTEKTSTAISWYKHVTNTIAFTLNCGELALDFFPATRMMKYAGKMYKARRIMKKYLYPVGKVIDKIEIANGAVEQFQECDQTRKEVSVTEKKSSSRQSYDPNIKIGPGTGSKNYLNSKDRLDYSIYFENKEDAGLPAQEVVILDTIDTKSLDISSFKFTSFSIGSRHFYLNDAGKTFVRTLDLRPGLNLKARVNGYIDSLTGIIRCEYQTIDVLTDQVTEDPLAGFLLPNNLGHDGEGSISYSIKPFESVSNGDEIKNKAAIYFDFNSPIITNVWSNKYDLVKPVSRVKALPSVSTSDTIIIKAEGADDMSGILYYELYAKQDSGDYFLLNPYLSSNGTDTLISSFEKKYSFYSIAIDTAGNRENLKTTSEATIFITKKLSDSICTGNSISFASGETIVPGSVYQWQINTGSGYSNISASTGYSGMNTDTLSLTVPPSSFAGYQFRCIISNAATKDTSVVHELHFKNVWTGSVNTQWENAANWSCGSVPDPFTEVIVKSNVTNFPEINSNRSCRSLSVQSGAAVKINTGFNLNITRLAQ